MLLVTGPSWIDMSPLTAAPVMSEDYEVVELDIQIITDWNTSLYLEWGVPDIPDTDDLEYTIYYSESEYGPYNILTISPITDQRYFTKWQVQDSKVFEQFFTIEIRDVFDNVYRSKPRHPGYSLPTWHRLRQREIFKREGILLDKFVGVETIVFNPKYRGKRCPECWDPVHLKVKDDHCEVCYGTSYEGGYDTGMRTLMQYSPIDPQSFISYQGRVEPITITAWTLAYPILFPDAIILRVPDRRAFIVEGHQGSTEMRTNTQRQTVVLKELSRDAVENRLFNNSNVVDIELRKQHINV